MSDSPILKQIDELVHKDDVVLFMKGNKNFPMCGFSATVVQMLNNLGVDFADYNVLENEELRQGIKDYTQWPTIPQLYIKGEFIGGADITREMYQSGELQELFQQKGITKVA
jgi:monothiol glutaredoxin